MSTVNAQNWGDGVNSVPTSVLLEGTVKQHHDYFQATPEIRDSYNVSSITDVNIGIYTVNYTNNFTGISTPTGFVAGLGGAETQVLMYAGNIASLTDYYTAKSATGTLFDAFSAGARFGDLA